MNDFLHTAERERLSDPFSHFPQDHRDATAREACKNGLGVFIELYNPDFGLLFERMPDHRARLVMFDLDRARPFLAAVVCPSQIACQDILWPLKPLKADDRGCGCFGLSAFDATPGKSVNLLSRGRGLCSLRAPLLGDTLPRVRDGAIELTWMKAMYNTPCATTQCDGLLALARAKTARSLANDVVNLVGADRRDRFDTSIADPVALLGDDIGNKQDGALIVRPGPRRDLFEICLALLVLTEQPIDGPVCSDTVRA